MVILFFLALVLAWPTAGLSIVAYVALLAVRGYLRGKVMKHEMQKRIAHRAAGSEGARLPSWMANRDKIDEFVNGVQSAAERYGVPKLFSAMVMNDQRIMKPLMYTAGSMEAQGASFVEQQMAVMEKLIELHQKA